MWNSTSQIQKVQEKKKIHEVHKVEELEVPKGSFNLALISKDGDIKVQSQWGWARGNQE